MYTSVFFPSTSSSFNPQNTSQTQGPARRSHSVATQTRQSIDVLSSGGWSSNAWYIPKAGIFGQGMKPALLRRATNEFSLIQPTTSSRVYSYPPPMLVGSGMSSTISYVPQIGSRAKYYLTIYLTVIVGDLVRLPIDRFPYLLEILQRLRAVSARDRPHRSGHLATDDLTGCPLPSLSGPERTPKELSMASQWSPASSIDRQCRQRSWRLSSGCRQSCEDYR